MKEHDEFSDINADVNLSSERIKEIANIKISSIAMKNLQASINAANQLVPTMSTALLDMVAQIPPVPLEPIIQALQSISKYIAETTVSIQIPGCPEEYRRRLTESYCAWGKCGWAWIGATPLKFYYKPPQNIADANKRIKPYHSKTEIVKLFDRLHTKKLRKSDLDSAIYCYQNRQYKPCVLMLFGMIDAKLIRKQTTIGNYRPVGGKAAKKLKAKYEQENDQYGFLALLRFANLFACLETVFADGKNFKDEPPVINRNYIDHGMNQRPVLKRDCIQLFFILENLLDFFDYPSII
jgi:hypothetical protein